jgi:hypothetical protein
MFAIGPVIPVSRNTLIFAEVGLQQATVSAQFDGGRRSYATAYGAVFGGGVYFMPTPHFAIMSGYSTADRLFVGLGWR